LKGFVLQRKHDFARLTRIFLFKIKAGAETFQRLLLSKLFLAA